MSRVKNRVAFGLSLAIVFVFFSGIFGRSLARGAEYFVSSSRGDDSASGTSPETAWRTLLRVSTSPELQGGDVVRFRCGDVWREGLAPRSGSEGRPIIYTSYGEGAKPSFWQSVSANRESDWVPVGENLWATRPTRVTTLRSAPNFFVGEWGLYAEGGAKARKTETDGTISVEIEQGGSAGSRVQLMKSPFSIRNGARYRLSFDASGKDVSGVVVSLMMQNSPWSSYGATTGEIKCSSEPTRQSLIFTSTQDAEDARLTFYLGTLPSGARLTLSNFEAEEVEVDALDLAPDVGNVVLDGGKAAFKKWTAEELTGPDEFFYERGEGRVWYYSKENPATRFDSIECARMRHVVNLSGVHDAIFDGLDIRNGGAHGFGGSGNARITIRNCDVSWIGGGDQYLQGGSGRRVRYGNGIEFWSSARDHVVENCRIWEVYDAALTNQGSGENQEVNITYRGNTIWNCEYSFEYWNRDATSITENIEFVDNVCMNAGYGWGHVQRPDKNGRCLMFYSNTAQTRGFVLKGNVFANATESLVRYDAEWTPEAPKMTENVYWQEDATVPYQTWLKKKYFKDDFKTFQSETGQEQGGRVERRSVEIPQL